MPISDIENAFDRNIFLTEINKEILKSRIVFSLFCNHRKNFSHHLEIDVADQKLKIWQKNENNPSNIETQKTCKRLSGTSLFVILSKQHKIYLILEKKTKVK